MTKALLCISLLFSCFILFSCQKQVQENDDTLSCLNTASATSKISLEGGSLITKSLLTGLIAFYPFNGNANDASSNHYNGIVSGASLASDRFGKAKSAYSFTGISPIGDHINVNAVFFNPGWTSFSISIWSNSNTIDNTPNGKIVQDIVGTIPAAVAIAYNWGGSNKYSMWASSNSPSSGWDVLYNYQSISNIVSNKWKHIVMVKNNTTYSIYIDGFLDNSINTNIVSTNSLRGLMIGAYENGGEPFNGKLDDIRIYNRALSQSEITYLATH